MKQSTFIVMVLIVVSCGRVKKENPNISVKVDSLDQTHYKEKDKEVVCFVYHRFDDPRFPTTNISISDFESHLKWLQNNNYQVLTLIDAIRYLKSEVPARKTAVITIDDGYKSFYENGFPLLSKYEMEATLFVNTETVGAGDYMSWQQLAILSKNGIEIGNHTHSHTSFLSEKQNERYSAFLDDIALAQKLFEDNLKLKPLTFAYPYGEFDDGMITIVKGLGFEGAVAQNSGVINSNTDKFQLPRFPMSEAYSKMFEEKAKMKSLNLISKTPTSPIIPKGNTKPTLSLVFNTEGLNMDQIQCFVQGSECKITITKKGATEINVSLQSTTSIIARRRTLYTLTIPDKNGAWHWYSHLWINPTIKE